MTRKEANAIMRNKYGASWFDRPGAKAERNSLMGGRAPRPQTSQSPTTRAAKPKPKSRFPSSAHAADYFGDIYGKWLEGSARPQEVAAAWREARNAASPRDLFEWGAEIAWRYDGRGITDPGAGLMGTEATRSPALAEAWATGSKKAAPGERRAWQGGKPRYKESRKKYERKDFKPGMKVSFQAKGRVYEGYVEKRLPKNIRVKIPGEGGYWRVHPSNLTPLGGDIQGYPIWRLGRAKSGKVTKYKKAVSHVSRGEGFVGIAEATPRKGRHDIGWWDFAIYKTPEGYTSPDLDFPDNAGPHATLEKMFAAIQEDAEMTGT